MNYDQLLAKFKHSEIDNRKHRMSFIQRLCEYLQFDVPFSKYKPVVIGSIPAESKGEVSVKNAYDSYNYLLANPNAFFGVMLLKKFYYILMGEEINRDVALNLQSFYYDFEDKPILEKIVEFHFYIYRVFTLNSEQEKQLISFLLTNYLLVVYHLAPIRLFKRDFKEYENVKILYEQGDHKVAIVFFIRLIHKQKPFSKQFYLSLKPISTEELLALIRADQSLLQKMYRVTNLVIFGSYAKHSARYDSDIDVMVRFEQDMSYLDKEKQLDQLRRFMFNRYGRICDVHDILPYIEESNIKGFIPYIKVF